MENKLKLKFSRMFRSSLDSCRSKSISDVSTVEQPFFFPQNRHHHLQLIQFFSPKPPPSRPFPSFCRPTLPENKNTHLTTRNRASSDRQNGQLKARDDGQIPKMTSRSSLLPSPANTMFNDCNPRPKHRRHRSKSRKTRQKKNDKFDEFFSSVAANYYGWYSSEDEKENTSKFDDETTFFSSKSMSSDSSVSFRAAAKNKVAATEKSETKEHYGDSDEENELTKICSAVDAKVKDSFAVIKRSSDPYNDFRTSMVEMIVEKQIFGSKDLENLLQCFLSLNSLTHHKVIIQVFTEIWETLFSDWN
ncbi:Transcription repressor [Heracleum sosnowskyi]|uniref:Transcription repressor n=1 Tax=Heracleum sosnowskyi TaxID=360622 RepID=A0AAD8N5L6_9APIA|nr:Transcription repressor [Heracleum sosnowskyi]